LDYFSLAVAKMDLAMYEEAIEDLDAAIGLDPEIPEAYYMRSTAKRIIGREKEAEADMALAVSLDLDIATRIGTLPQHPDA